MARKIICDKCEDEILSGNEREVRLDLCSRCNRTVRTWLQGDYENYFADICGVLGIHPSTNPGNLAQHIREVLERYKERLGEADA